jgi:Protein of unknown function (DUF2384)
MRSIAPSEWLSKPDASLGNTTPLDLLDTDLIGDRCTSNHQGGNGAPCGGGFIFRFASVSCFACHEGPFSVYLRLGGCHDFSPGSHFMDSSNE